MKHVFNLPLWILLTVWLLLRRSYVMSTDDIGDYLDILEQMRDLLPLPSNFLERWIVTRIYQWIDREVESAVLIALLRGLIFVGNLK